MINSNYATIPGSIVSIPPDSVGAAELKPDSVGTSELQPNSVTTAEIVDGTVQETDMKQGMTGSFFVDGGIPFSKLAAGSISPGLLPHPMGLQDIDYTGVAPGRLTGSKIDPPVKSIIQFNGTPLPPEFYLNFLGTAGLLDIADDAANNRVNINLQGIITNAPVKGTNAQVKNVGGSAGNLVGAANAWAGADHEHFLKVIPISGGNAQLLFAPDLPTSADTILERVAAGQLRTAALTITGLLTVSSIAAPAGQNLSLEAPLGYVYPARNSAIHLGHPSLNWLNVYANGFISPGGLTIQALGASNQDFYTNGALQVRLDQNGFVGVGTLAPALAGEKLEIKDGIVLIGLSRTNKPSGDWLYVRDTDGSLAGYVGYNNQSSFVIGSNSRIRFANTTGEVGPNGDNVISLGVTGVRWSAVWAVNGTIQTSTQQEKENITPIDPVTALNAVLNSPVFAFDYVQAPYVEPERIDGEDEESFSRRSFEAFRQYQETLESRAIAKHQIGITAETADPLLILTDKKSISPSHIASVALASIQELNRRIDVLATIVGVTF